MRKFLFGTVAALSLGAFANSSHAADLMDYPIGFDWAGTYIGGHIGYGFGDNSWATRGVGPVSTPDADFDGFTFGGALGYNMMVSPSFLIGVETDFSVTDITANSPGGGGFGCDGGVCRTDVEWYGSTRVRLGYAMPESLVYATGGVAYGHVEGADGALLAVGLTSGEDLMVGWTVGAGFEHVVAANLTAKIEYLYTDLGRLELPNNCGPDCYTDVSFHTVRAGINYHF